MKEIHFVAQDFEIKYNTDLRLEWKSFKTWSDELDIATSLSSIDLYKDSFYNKLNKTTAFVKICSEYVK